MKGWYAIVPTQDIKTSKPLSIKRFSLDLVVWKNKQNEIRVLLDRCPHRGAKLSLGKIVNDTVVCPFHGYQFNAKGACDYAPEFQKAIPGLCTKTFVVHEAFGMVWLYWGETPEAFDYPTLAEIHNTFKKQYSQTSRLWNSHITYCVENQLDYTHLPFVHRNTIGRGFKIPEHPAMNHTEKSISVEFHADGKKAFEYFYPNLWILHVSEKMKLIVFFVPMDETHTLFYLRTYRSFLNNFLVKRLFDWIMNKSNLIILNQDQHVVASQGTEPSYKAENQLLMKHDAAIKAFRKNWAEKC